MQQKYWPGLCRALGVEGLESDPRFAKLNIRQENNKQLVEVIDNIFVTRTAKEWLERLAKNNVIHALVQDYPEAASDPQVVENGYVVDFNHPIIGPTQFIGTPVRLSETPGRIRQSAPQLGQHTEEVLREIGGYNREEIAKFREEGLI